MKNIPLTKQTILKHLQQHKKELQSNYQVKRIGLFGSYAKDEATPQSDIDLIVDMPSSFEKYYGLKEYLENLFGKEIDLGMIDNMRHFIRKRVEKDIIYV
jgi:predicted nucleotidyltransferase